MGSLIHFFIVITFNFGISSKHSVVYSSQVLPNSNVELRITGGVEAKEGEFPYAAALLLRYHDGRLSGCGGTLISTTSILTAAHCLDGKKSAEIFLGIKGVPQTSTEHKKQTFTSTKFIIHPNYTKYSNDLAILKLPHPAKLNEHVKIIRIPSDDKHDYADKTGKAIGWGKTSDSQADGVWNTLHTVDNPILSNRACESYFDVVPDTDLCQSSKDDKSTCNGDSGGPLVVDGVQVGVLALGFAQCQEGYPSIFTRLSKYINWIKAHE